MTRYGDIARAINGLRTSHGSIELHATLYFPCAMALRLTSRSSRRRIPFVTVASGLRFVLSPVGPTRLRWLDISNGCQNHTTSPYAAPSPVTPIGEMPMRGLAKALKRRSSAQTLDRSRENPPCDHDRARRRCVHRIQPRVRDDRDTPLLPGWMAGVIAVIWPVAEAVYFFERGWTASIKLIWLNKSR